MQSPPRRRFAPLRIRLPLLVAGVIALCTAAVIAVSYRAVRLSTARDAANRLQAATGRVAATLELQVRQTTAALTRLSGHPAIARWTRGDTAAARALADSLLHASPQNAAVALRAGGRALIAGDAAALDASRAWTGTGVGPFLRFDAHVAYPLRVALTPGGDTAGALEIVRVLDGANSNTTLINGLVGRDASFVLGDADGSLWTSLAGQVVPPPPPDMVHTVLASRRGAAERGMLAGGVAIAGTPWVAWIDQPATVALAAATSVMWRLVVIALVGVLLGALVSWFLIRHVTAPLDDLAHASEALARGDYARRMTYAGGGDEIGRLAASFNDMADQIQRHNQNLEDQVAERTVALEKALFDLQVAQAEMVKRERLAILGQLAGGVGHELRNPLGVMTNAVYVLDTIAGDGNQMVRDYLGILRGQIVLSEKIISDLLDFARTKPASRLTTTAGEIVRAQLARLDAPGNVTVELDIPDTMPRVTVDPVQVGQVVFNLVMNGVQAMGDTGGVLRCRASHDGNGAVRLDVADTGPGMPPDVAAHVFEPLFTTKARGLGLGLTVSRLLAQNNGGQLTFETAVGAGTTFTLTMPTAS